MSRFHYGQEKEKFGEEEPKGGVEIKEQVDKKPLVLIGTPYYGGFTHEFVISSYASLHDLQDTYHIAMATAESAQVHLNRNIICKSAYDNNADYLLFIDTDMYWMPSHIDTLIRFGRDVVGGLCTTRKTPQKNCVYENDGRGMCRSMTEIPKVPFKCFAIGTGFLLLSRMVVRTMWDNRHKDGYPFDPIPHGMSESECNALSAYRGTDISFCQRLRKRNIDIWCHPDVKVGHVGKMVYGRKDNG